MATEPRFEGGNLVVDELSARGVRFLFSVSGGPLNSIYRATVGSPLHLIHTRHEAGAAFMAEAVGRLTGVPGVALVTLGPGVTNTLTAVLTARLGGAPLLVIAGQAATGSFDRGAGMSFDPLPVVTPLVKWAARVLSTDRIPEYLDAAWRHLLSPRPGPVFLEIPVDVLAGPASRSLTRRRVTTTYQPSIDSNAITRVEEELARAKRPLLIAGDDVRWAGAHEELRRASEAHGIPVTLARLARGQVDERHPLCAGPAYLGANQAFRRALTEADLVLLVGHDFEFDIGFGQSVSPTAKVVHSHPDASLLGRNLAPDLALHAGSRSVLAALSEMSPSRCSDTDWLRGLPMSWRAERSAILDVARKAGPALHPARVVELVQQATEEQTVFVSSHGNVDFWADACIQVTGPNRYLRAGQSGSLGAEIPYGIAAGLALPGVPVVVFVGDGGFAFQGLELETALRYDSPVVVVVLDDGRWGAIALPQARAYGVEVEMELPSRDWAAVVRGLSGYGERVNSEAELVPALRRAQAARVPAVVQVAVRSVESPYMSFISQS